MRVIVSTLIALALVLLPGAQAHADEMAPAAEASMACHESAQGMNHDQPGPSEDMKACASHCLSHVNAQPTFARVTAPSLQNQVSAERFDLTYLGHPRDGDPPEPPPPRI